MRVRSSCAGVFAATSPGRIRSRRRSRRCTATPRIAADTDWSQILALYDQLMIVQPSAVVALNRAVAVAEVDGAAAALEIVDALDLDTYVPFHVTPRRLPEEAGSQR